jgi:enoyl-CoA hydratase/methylglutaconyl-CoA hydratase
MPDELVHVHTESGVTTVTLDSPHNRNALSRRLVTELLAAFDVAETDPSVRVVVVAAAGPVFCSGADLAEAADGGMAEGARGLVRLQRRIVELPLPVVVRLHGPARAGGLGIVGAADVVLAADTVTFAFTEVRLGLAPATISLTTLPRMSDRAAALTYLGGEPFDAPEAMRVGLVTRAVPPAELDASVDAVVSSILRGSPQGLRETKALLAAPLLERIDRHGEDLAAQSARLFASPEARAAMRAFLDRRS